MKYHIRKGDTSLLLLELGQPSGADTKSVQEGWAKILSHFHYDEDAEFNFIKIASGDRSYVGFALKTKPEKADLKVNRYAEGLAFQIVTHFPDAKRRILSQDECLAVVRKCLGFANGQPSPDYLRVLIARLIDPKIIMDKIVEFEAKDRTNPLSLEKRLGMKPCFNPALLQFLDQSYIAFDFVYEHSADELRRGVDADKGVERCADFVKPFFSSMSVPDSFVEAVKQTENASEMIGNHDLMLLSLWQVAGLAAGYR